MEEKSREKSKLRENGSNVHTEMTWQAVWQVIQLRHDHDVRARARARERERERERSGVLQQPDDKRKEEGQQTSEREDAHDGHRDEQRRAGALGQAADAETGRGWNCATPRCGAPPRDLDCSRRDDGAAGDAVAPRHPRGARHAKHALHGRRERCSSVPRRWRPLAAAGLHLFT